jgi:hypothetical protein
MSAQQMTQQLVVFDLGLRLGLHAEPGTAGVGVGVGVGDVAYA